jgi:ABC-type antimicrobial peptide transport system permease subunit
MASTLLRDLLFGIGPADPVAFAAAAAAMIVVTLGACYVPVRRALNVDPIAALR